MGKFLTKHLGILEFMPFWFMVYTQISCGDVIDSFTGLCIDLTNHNDLDESLMHAVTFYYRVLCAIGCSLLILGTVFLGIGVKFKAKLDKQTNIQ